MDSQYADVQQQLVKLLAEESFHGIEIKEAMSARRSERQPKGRRRCLICHGHGTSMTRWKHIIIMHANGLGNNEHMSWQIDYCIMKEGMSILKGRKSVPGMNSGEREMERGYYSAFT
nr:hypothetical protein [Tanacetum cinerariifolium]